MSRHTAAFLGFFAVCLLTIGSHDSFPAAVKKGTAPRGEAAPKQQAAPDSSRRAADMPAAAPPAAKLFSLRIVTTPDSAAVLLDDSAKGISPCTIAGVSKGGHVLTLKKKGYYAKKAEIQVDSASPAELSFTLLAPGFLRIESNPAGAAVSLDGAKAGLTPFENDKIKPGDHLVSLELAGYNAVSRTLTLAGGGRDTLKATLEHSPAYQDSVVAAERAVLHQKRERFTISVVSGAFCIAALILLVLEAGGKQ